MRPDTVDPEHVVACVRRDGCCDIDVRTVESLTAWLEAVYVHARQHDLRLSHVTVGDVVTLVDARS